VKAHITVGIPASGKTTWAKAHARETGAIISNRDDLRFSMSGHDRWDTFKFNGKFERMVTDLQKAQAELAQMLGKDFILSDTNLNNEKRQQWIEYLLQLGFEDVIIKEFPITLTEAILRDRQRGDKRVGVIVLQRMYQQWIEYKGEDENNSSRQ
jgi:predicted kinase